MMEIEKILARMGASHIYKMYDEGVPRALAFKVFIKGQEVGFKLPMNEDKLLQVFKTQVSNKQLPRKYWEDTEQARRTGWRIIKDWIDSQMALLEIELVKIEEIFLPYMYDAEKDKTLFEILEARDFDLTRLEDKRDR